MFEQGLATLHGRQKDYVCPRVYPGRNARSGEQRIGTRQGRTSRSTILKRLRNRIGKAFTVAEVDY